MEENENNPLNHTMHKNHSRVSYGFKQKWQNFTILK
jgi:hypothetical protein